MYNQHLTYETLFQAARELESELAATKSAKVAKAAKVKVQGGDTQAKSASVSVSAEDLGTSAKKKKKGGASQEDSSRGGGPMSSREASGGASGSSVSNNNNNQSGISAECCWCRCS